MLDCMFIGIMFLVFLRHHLHHLYKLFGDQHGQVAHHWHFSWHSQYQQIQAFRHHYARRQRQSDLIHLDPSHQGSAQVQMPY